MAVLHGEQRSPRTVPVKWSWSTWRRVPGPTCVERQIAHLRSCCSMSRSSAALVSPYFRRTSRSRFASLYSGSASRFRLDLVLASRARSGWASLHALLLSAPACLRRVAWQSGHLEGVLPVWLTGMNTPAQSAQV